VISLQSLARAIGYSLARRRADEIAAERIRAELAEQQECARLEAEKAADVLRAPARARDAARGRRWLTAHQKAVRTGEEAALILAQRDLAERQAREAEEAEQRHRQQAEWLAELERRRVAELDPDGSLAEARKARDEQLEQERLDFLTAQLVRRTA